MLLLAVNTLSIDCKRFDQFNAVVVGYDFFQGSTSDHSVFVCHSSAGTIFLIVYVDYIIISRSLG